MRTIALFLAATALQVSAQIFPAGAKLEKLFEGGHLTEGAAVAPDGSVFFSDITFTSETGMQAGHIMRYDPATRKASVFRSPSGMANGIKFDAQGRMVVAEGADFGGRRITRTDLATGKSMILAGLFQGKPFNSPNDITIDRQGRVYFSDPKYLGHEAMEQPLMAVYRIDLDGSVHRIVTDAGKPNGIAISPDEKTLYVVTNDDGVMGFDRLPKGTPLEKAGWNSGIRSEAGWFRLVPKDVGELLSRRWTGWTGVRSGGNLYVAVRDEKRFGIYVYTPSGKEIAYLPTPERPTNVGFGRGDKATDLYITAGGSLYRIKVEKPGYQLPSNAR